MSLFKNITKAAGGVLKSAAKNVVKQLPGAKAVTAVVATVKDVKSSGSKSSSKSSTTRVSASKSVSSTSKTGDVGIIRKGWDWMMKQMKDNPLLFWAVILPVFIGVVLVIIWLLWRFLIKPIFGKMFGRRRSTYTPSSRSSRSKTYVQKSSFGPSKSTKRKASPAQLEALAKGRAKLKKMRR